MAHSEDKIKNWIFGLGLIVDACVFFAIGATVLKGLKESPAELPKWAYLLLVGMGLALLTHHFFIYTSFKLFEEYRDKESELGSIIGCSENWLKNSFHYRICFLVALLFAGLTGEIPYMVVVLSQLPIEYVSGLSQWLVEHHGTTTIFIWISITITGLLVLWSLIGLVMTEVEARKRDERQQQPAGGFKISFLALWLFSDTLACLNWFFVLRFMRYEGKSVVGVLIATSALYCLTMLLRLFFSPPYQKPPSPPRASANTAAAGSRVAPRVAGETQTNNGDDASAPQPSA